MTGPDHPVSDSEIDEHMNERDGRPEKSKEGTNCLGASSCMQALFVLSRAGISLSDRRSHRPVCIGLRARIPATTTPNPTTGLPAGGGVGFYLVSMYCCSSFFDWFTCILFQGKLGGLERREPS